MPEFPISWPDADDANIMRRRDRWHFPDPATPLSGDIFGEVGVGFSRTMAAQGAPVRIDVRRINTYVYLGAREVRPGDPPAREGQRIPGRYENHDAWDNEWLPELQGFHGRWQSLDRDNASASELLAHLDEALEWNRRHWEVHSLLDFSIEGLVAFCGRELGWDMPRTELLVTGIMNKSLESDDALRDLAAMVRASAELSAVFTERPAREVLSALPSTSGAAAFTQALDAFLSEFGHRSDNFHELAFTSWIEDPAPVLALIRAYVVHPERDHAAMREGLVARREAAIAEARLLLASKPEQTREKFERELALAQRASELNETHNYWIDQRALYWLRRDFLAAGRLLAGAGVIDRADDVFYLRLAEVLAALAGDTTARAGEVTARRAEMAHFGSFEPPMELGLATPPEVAAGMDLAFGGHDRSEVANEVHGQPGSPGSVTGRARIIGSLMDSDRFEPGDILVAKTTSPPWTPLFGIAAAVVTDAGGALSHCAIVAREYGIPAVVGCVDATARIADGSMITVDGDAGVVRLGA